MEIRERVKRLLQGKGGNYIAPFFWQHGEEEAVLREYMQKIQEANIGAVCVESRPHPDFVGEKWWKDMDVILDEAKTRGMRVWILDDQHFPTGYAAGAMEHADKELCHQYLDYNVLESWGPRPQLEIQTALYAKPQPLPPWLHSMPGEPKRKHHDDALLRVIACPVEEKGTVGAPLDLTALAKDGRILWDVPEGYWKIYVIYLTRDARGRNDYINFLDEESCRILIDTVYEPHYARYKELFGTVIAGFFSDEPPIGNTPGYTRGDLIGNPTMALPWSKEMASAMEREYGTGWELFLPYLWNTGSDSHQTARIRTAYMNAVSRLVSKCFSSQLGAWCEEHGVEYIGHMLEDCDSNANLGPSMGHFFRGLSGQHMAGIDNIGGQVLPGGQNVRRHEPDMCQDSAGFYHYMLGRMGASMAAIDPKKQGRCMCENFGAYGWRLGVKTAKYLNDHFMARGVNRFVPHAFSPKAFPDPDCPPHFYAHGENPQFRAFGELMAYTNRICELIDGGTADASVALLYHGESEWAGAYESNILACRTLTQHQISFLIVPADVFAQREESRTSFDKEARVLRIGDTECRALVISGCDYLTKPAAMFVLEAQEAGFPVVFTGRLPKGVSDVSSEESAQIMERLKDCVRKEEKENGCMTDAGVRRKENCCVVSVEELGAALGSEFRDVVLEREEKNLTVYHYQNGGEVYLFLNEDAAHTVQQWITLPCEKQAVVYDAWNNRILPARTRTVDGKTQVCAKLAPLEMMVLLCGAAVPEPEGELSAGENRRTEADMEPNAWEGTQEDKQPEAVYNLDAFTVTRCGAKEYPHFASPEAADLKHGMSAAHPEFSGFYRYETLVNLKGWQEAELVIEDAFEAAEVFVNGASAGLRIAQPYRYEIKNLLKDGENEIAIEVATTLERSAAMMGIRDGGMGAVAPLSPTGIIGAVTLKKQR